MSCTVQHDGGGGRASVVSVREALGRMDAVVVGRFGGGGDGTWDGGGRQTQPTYVRSAVGDLRSFLMVVAQGWWGDVHLRCALSCLPSSCD